MKKCRFSLRNVATIVACLAVSFVMSCGGDKKDDDSNDKGWPSAAILAKYGLDGLNKPSGFAGAQYIETGGVQLVITVNGNASTATSVKGYFTGSSSWIHGGESTIGGYTTNTYAKESDGTGYVATFTEMEGNSFQLQVVKATL
jgi:hypothetical protein